MFSYYARKAGLKVWMCPWMELEHVGSYVFGGSLAAMAAIQASPTASAESSEKGWLTKAKQDDIVSDTELSKMNRNQRRAVDKLKRMK
jgi:hypothetical protein